MDKIKFGTDGWRAIIAKEYTVANLVKLAYATSLWLNKKYPSPSVVVGYDCRFGGEMFMEAVVKIFASKGIQVYIPDSFVTTPMVSLAVIKLKAQCGIMITGSHCPAEFNGYKIRGEYGGPLLENELKTIEDLISDEHEIDLELLDWNIFLKNGLIQYVNFDNIYLKDLGEHISLDIFRENEKNIIFDSMYGSSQNIIKKLFPNIYLLHSDFNPSFNGIPPEPIPKNLHELTQIMHRSKKYICGIATDGDGDRLAMFDEDGEYISPNHIILLLIHYLAKYKNLSGKVVVNYATTTAVDKLCKYYNLPFQRVKIGFKEITKVMLQEDVLIGAEESGGIAFGSFIPERDAIFSSLLVLSCLQKTGKNLKKLLSEVENITGRFYFSKQKIIADRNIRQRLIDKCSNTTISFFEDKRVIAMDNYDGYKYFFSEYDWMLIRLSGTEPAIRLYWEAQTQEQLEELINIGLKFLNELKTN